MARSVNNYNSIDLLLLNVYLIELTEILTCSEKDNIEMWKNLAQSKIVILFIYLQI